MKVSGLLTAAAAAVLLVGCSDNRFSDGFTEAFLTNCTAQGASMDYCLCSLSFLEQNVDDEEEIGGDDLSAAIQACEDRV